MRFFFVRVGGVILLGFLSNLLFRVTKIPSVLLLKSIGVLLGPVTGVISSASLLLIAPYLGTIVLRIILFEGRLEFDIITVAKEAPRSILIAVVVFVLSVSTVMLFV